MFKHILVATDGSKLSQKAVRVAAKMAGASGARLTGCYVMPPYAPPAYVDETSIYVPETTPEEYKRSAELRAKKALAAVKSEASTAGAPNAALTLTADTPWRGILRAAKAKKCDLIVMASHGRSGFSSLLLGSESAKVLSHSKIPLLICR